MKRFIINTILISIILNIYILVISEEYFEKNIKQISEVKTADLKSKNINQEIQFVEKEYPKEDFEATFNGYEVCAKLEIPKISLNTIILSEYSEEALKISPTKFWGVNPNQIGNFCIVGHNFVRDNMFHDLKKLELGDTFFVTDRDVGKVEYEVFSIYKVLPDDVSPLDSKLIGEREVTLITCTSDSKERIIIKAKEKI